MASSESRAQNIGSRDYRKAFGQFSSSKTQRPNTLKATEVELDDQEDVAGGVHTIDFEKGDIVIKQSGMYLLISSLSPIGKVRGMTPRWIDFWVRVNNIDVPNSNIRAVVIGFARKNCCTHERRTTSQ